MNPFEYANDLMVKESYDVDIVINQMKKMDYPHHHI